MGIRQMAALAATAIVLAGTAACGGGSGTASKALGGSGGTGTSGAKSSAHTSAQGSSQPSDDSPDENATPSAGLADFTDYCSLVDPAPLTAIGLDPTKKLATPKGELQDPSCLWGTRSTQVLVSGSLGKAVHFEEGEQQDISGFQGVAKYDNISNVCDVQVQVGTDDLQVVISDAGDYTPALKGKGCAPTIDLARQAVDKLKTKK